MNRTEYDKQRHAKNKEKMNQMSRKYYQEHKEHLNKLAMEKYYENKGTVHTANVIFVKK